METVFKKVTVYKVGHPLYPAGAVVVEETDDGGAVQPTQTYTLEAWAALQQSGS